MSKTCVPPKCERTSRALCDCCQQTLCLQHLSEHNASLVSQLNSLTDEINALADRLHRLNLHAAARDCRERLEEWRQDCHQKIDRFFEQKSEELDRLIATKIDEQREKVLDIQTKLAKLIREQEATRQDIDTLTSTIDDLKKEMNKIEGSHFRIDTCPLSINDKMVQFKEVHGLEFDLSFLLSVYKTVVHQQGSWHALASSGRLLLIHEEPNLCFLNAESTIVKQVLWPHGKFDDICWSSTLDRFIVIANDNIFLVDENTMSIESVQTIEQQRWFSCTCSNTQLFLSTYAWGSSVMEFRLSPLIAIVEQWNSPRTCTKNELVDDIVYNNGTLAVMIRNKVENPMRMELRSCMTLDRLWSLSLDVVYNEVRAIHCCSLDNYQWLVTDFNAGCLLHITADGKMKQIITYKQKPYRITLFSLDMLVLCTKSRINFHKI